MRTFRTSPRTLGLISAIGAFALAVAACSSTPEAPEETPENQETEAPPDEESEPAVEVETLSVLELNAVPDPLVSYTSLVDSLGTFEKHNLDVEISRAAGGGPQKIQALEAGAADVVTSDILAVMNAINQGVEARIIMVGSAKYGATIVAHKSITSFEDLRGKNYGVPSLAGSSAMITDLVMEANDLSREEVNYLALGSTPEMIPALVSGRVSAATFNPGVIPLMADYADSLHVLLPSSAVVTPPFPNYVIVTSQSVIDEKPEALKRYVSALIEGTRAVAEDSGLYVDFIEESMDGDISREDAQALWEVLSESGYWAVNGGIDVAAATGVVEIANAMPEAIENPRVTSGEQLYEFEFVRHALDEQGVVEDDPDQPDWY